MAQVEANHLNPGDVIGVGAWEIPPTEHTATVETAQYDGATGFVVIDYREMGNDDAESETLRVLTGTMIERIDH